jgi:hypothetical protein
MLYKTITLELIQDEYPALHNQLRASRTLLSAVGQHAAALKRYHEDRKDRLAQAKPDSEESQLVSEALEMAIDDLKQDLRSASPPAATEPTFSLDEAIASVRRATPSA